MLDSRWKMFLCRYSSSWITLVMFWKFYGLLAMNDPRVSKFGFKYLFLSYLWLWAFELTWNWHFCPGCFLFHRICQVTRYDVELAAVNHLVIDHFVQESKILLFHSFELCDIWINIWRSVLIDIWLRLIVLLWLV